MLLFSHLSIEPVPSLIRLHSRRLSNKIQAYTMHDFNLALGGTKAPQVESMVQSIVPYKVVVGTTSCMGLDFVATDVLRPKTALKQKCVE